MRQLDEHFEAVTRLWDAHLRDDFPANLRGAEPLGIDMVLLDAYIAGCISTWLRNQGSLDAGRQTVLANCLTDLDRVLPLLVNQRGYAYYSRLRTMAAATLVEPQ